MARTGPTERAKKAASTTPTVSPVVFRRKGDFCVVKTARAFPGKVVLWQLNIVATNILYLHECHRFMIHVGTVHISIHGASGVAWWLEVDGCFHSRFRWVQVRG